MRHLHPSGHRLRRPGAGDDPDAVHIAAMAIIEEIDRAIERGREGERRGGAPDATLAVECCQIEPPTGVPLDEVVRLIANDQRAWGPGRLILGGVDRAGRLRCLAMAVRAQPIELGMLPLMLGLRSTVDDLVAVIAWCDEPVRPGAPTVDDEARFLVAAAQADVHGLHLVDWLACDDLVVRSARTALDRRELAPWESGG